jgi:hypothetical protein
MKLLTDQKMRAISNILATSSAAEFPLSNLRQYDPDLIWKPTSFGAPVNIVFDLGVPGAIDYIWLNNANFLNVTIQANSADTWDSPPVSESVTLEEDDVGVVKGFFHLTTTHYRYVRVVIPVQTLVDGGSVPFLGNVILGDTESLLVSSWEPAVQEDFTSFVSDGGNYSEFTTGKARHVFSASMQAVTKAEVDAAPLKGWSVAVLFTDLGSVADSYLVYAPKGKRLKVRSQIDCDLEFVLRQLV